MLIKPLPLYPPVPRDERGLQRAHQLNRLSPGHTRSWAIATSSSRETEASRASGQDVEGHLDTSGYAPQEVTDNT